MKIRSRATANASPPIALPHFQFHPTWDHSIVFRLERGHCWSIVDFFAGESNR